MIQNNIILNNPIIPTGYYTAKVIAIEKELARNYYLPKLQITLQLHPSYGLSTNDLFYALIHPTEKSYYHYENLFNTFLFSNYVEIDIIDKAIGEWGSVEISKSEFEEIEYSIVRFVYQPLKVRFETLRMMRYQKIMDDRLIVNSRKLLFRGCLFSDSLYCFMDS